MGEDGFALLGLIDAETSLPWLRELPAVQTLRQVWAEQYADPPGPVHWREKKDRGSSLDIITSPYDTEALLTHQARNGLGWIQSAFHRDV
jgi:transposase